ncbi:ankyrin repeat domain-containing protein [Aestuariispira insulae]|nr:ankyrin repeat domain-containing protein [Aestuariispira insulae]
MNPTMSLAAFVLFLPLLFTQQAAADQNNPSLFPALLIKQNQPEKAAEQAAARGDFRLLLLDHGWNSSRPGVLCFLNRHLKSERDHYYLVGDTETGIPLAPETGEPLPIIPSEEKVDEYARRFNRTVVMHSHYPDPDICWPSRDDFLSSGPRNPDFRPNQHLTTLERFSNPAQPIPPEPDEGKLAWATRFGQSEMAKSLLDAGHSPNQADRWNMSPLDWAAARGRDGILDLLINAGADPYIIHGLKEHDPRYTVAIQKDLGFSAMRLAIITRRSDIVRKLISLIQAKAEEPCVASYPIGRGMVLAVHIEDLKILNLLYNNSETERGCKHFESRRSELKTLLPKIRNEQIRLWLTEHADLLVTP